MVCTSGGPKSRVPTLTARPVARLPLKMSSISPIDPSFRPGVEPNVSSHRRSLASRITTANLPGIERVSPTPRPLPMSVASATHLQRRALRRNRAIATALLVAMAGLFIATTLVHEPGFWVLLVRATAEAAMVGGLADWFAVTALFRHPLGLPIPHTAIIPRNKDRIGEALANFIRENFLIPSVVARRMQKLDFAGAAGRFLQTPAGEGTRIRAGASRLIADIFESLDDERLGGFVKGAISARLRKTEVSPLLGHALASAINEERHVPMLEAAIRWTARALDANEPLIREMVHKKANWVLKLAGLDTKLADAIIEGL